MNDSISRQAAIKALNEQIELCNKALSSFDISMKDEYAVKVEKKSLEAYRETLEALPSAQPETHDKRTETHACDLISRQAVIEALCSECQGRCIPCDSYPCSEVGAIKAVPSTQPERKKGRWINRSLNVLYPEWERYTCSVCGKHSDSYDYCPNCGADMRQKEGSDV